MAIRINGTNARETIVSPSQPGGETVEIFAFGGDDIVIGGGGDDILRGGNGNDMLMGGAGRDTIEGGAGSDTVNYATDTPELLPGFNINLATQRVVIGVRPSGATIVETLSSIENAIGSSFDDTITGNDLSNRLEGRGGNDTIIGGGGGDEIFGEAGADTLSGGDGNDFLSGGAGIDSIFGGTGIDTVSYAGDTPELLPGFAINLATQRVVIGIGPGGEATFVETLSSIENAIGSSFDDTITGSSGNNRLEGGAGEDTISGGGGFDTIVGGAGADRLTGGTGSDTFVFDSLRQDFVIEQVQIPGGGTTLVGRSVDVTDTITDFNLAFDRLDFSAIVNQQPGFQGTFDSANSNGYLYLVQHGTAGQAGFGTAVFFDPNGGAHNALEDIAVVDLLGVSQANLTNAGNSVFVF